MSPSKAGQRPALNIVSPFVMALVLANVKDALRSGHSFDDVARHLHSAGLSQLQRDPNARWDLILVLEGWRDLLVADAEAATVVDAMAGRAGGEIVRPVRFAQEG